MRNSLTLKNVLKKEREKLQSKENHVIKILIFSVNRVMPINILIRSELHHTMGLIQKIIKKEHSGNTDTKMLILEKNCRW